MTAPLLRIEGLRTWFTTRAGTVKAVDGVDLDLRRGEILGLVGESGSGKSVLGKSILGLIEPPGRIAEGHIFFNNPGQPVEDLVSASARRFRELRGSRIAMIFQDPMMSLNPVLRIDTQMIEAIRAHRRISHGEARQRARDMLGKVGIPSPDERLLAYPHQFSGGMRQRVMVAIALLNGPDLVIADEPTTALDVTVQAQILHEVRKLCSESGTALIWITHDMALVSGLADRIAVMYAGRVIETGTVKEMITAPRHPYTAGLLQSVPSNNVRGQPLRQIPGMTPSLLKLPPGCSFQPRCERRVPGCAAAMHYDLISPTHQVQCINPLSPNDSTLSETAALGPAAAIDRIIA